MIHVRAFAVIVGRVSISSFQVFEFSLVPEVSVQNLLRPLQYFKSLENSKTSTPNAANIYRKRSTEAMHFYGTWTGSAFIGGSCDLVMNLLQKSMTCCWSRVLFASSVVCFGPTTSMKLTFMGAKARWWRGLLFLVLSAGKARSTLSSERGGLDGVRG